MLDFGIIMVDSSEFGKKLVSYILIIGGLVLIFSESGIITGNVVGATSSSSSFKIVLGVVGLVLGVFLSKYKKKIDREMKI